MSKKLTTIARKYGATIDAPSGDSVFYADAPHGYKWVASDCHVICVSWDDIRKREAAAYLIADMEQGTERCYCEECREAHAA